MSTGFPLGSISYLASNADPYWSSVVALVANDNAASGTTTFLDQSTSAKTVTRGGSAIYSDVSAPTGMTTSVRLARATSDSLSMADSADWDYGSGAFTLEGYFNPDIATAGGALIEQANGESVYSPAGVAYSDSFGTSGKLHAWVSQSGSSWNAGPGNATTTVGTGSWHHFALTRTGDSWTMWLDGVSDWTATISGTLFNSTKAMKFGNFQGQFLTAYICSFRITKGVCRYTGTFTPPSLPLPTE